LLSVVVAVELQIQAKQVAVAVERLQVAQIFI
jgi:hypothetical protein